MTRDPICGATVDPLRARAVGIFGGRTFYFCSPEHKAEFARDPSAHLSRLGGAPVAEAPVEQAPARERSLRRKVTPQAHPPPPAEAALGGEQGAAEAAKNQLSDEDPGETLRVGGKSGGSSARLYLLLLALLAAAGLLARTFLHRS